MPMNVFKRLLVIAGIKEAALSPSYLENFWHTKVAGSKGAYTRMNLYGNFGTLEGRRKGGLTSIKTHNKFKTGFITLKSISVPRHSTFLAEFLGILMGDGHLSEYQTSITTNSKTDREHALFVSKLGEKLFRVSPFVRENRKENAMDIVFSSKRLVEFMSSLGMPQGNKIKNNLRIPLWVKESTEYSKAFIRGLFDTDGCIYLDKHCINGRIYYYLGWAVTSYSISFRSDIVRMLKRLGFAPTCRLSQRSVYLRKQSEVDSYFSSIGTNNQKHYKRFIQFRGRVLRIGKEPLSKSGARKGLWVRVPPLPPSVRRSEPTA